MSGPVLLGLRILAAIALYAFLAGALFLLWQTLRQQTQFLEKQQSVKLTLGILNEGGQQVIEFITPEILVGRDPECDLTLEDGTVSARHARISFRQAQWWVEDWSSKNGTRLNDELLTVPAVITSGDIIACGQAKLVVLEQ